MQWLGIMFMAALLVIVPGFGSAQQQKDTSAVTAPQGPGVKGEPAGTVKSFTPAERKAYEEKTAEELDAIQQKIAELRINSATGAPQKKRLIMQAANNLQMQQSAAESRLAALKKASAPAWGAQKADLDKAMAELRQAWGPTAIHPK
jgi:hypothetical protein